MQKVKVHELRKLSDADLIDRLGKERVSAASVTDSGAETTVGPACAEGLLPGPGQPAEDQSPPQGRGQDPHRAD